jgi:hypothetical protein
MHSMRVWHDYPFIILVISNLGLSHDFILQTDDLSIHNIAIRFLIFSSGLQSSLARVRINWSCQVVLFDPLHILGIDVCFGVELVWDVSEKFTRSVMMQAIV